MYTVPHTRSQRRGSRLMLAMGTSIITAVTLFTLFREPLTGVPANCITSTTLGVVE